MKLKFKQQVIIGFMLFSLFFGAGNLIFPSFLGKIAGENMPLALFGFCIPAVVLPVLGVIIVAKFDGLDKLAGKVNKKFAIIFTVLILLSIGPGLGIPRAASVPFEMTIKPYLNNENNAWLFMLIYSLIFFALALWLAMTPSKLIKRIGGVLTPTLLILLLVLFVTYMIKGGSNIAKPTEEYIENSFLSGFCYGYLTMDTIAALNFGLVISGALYTMGIKEKNTAIKYTVKTGIVAGAILALIYLSLSYIGMSTSALYPETENGAEILRHVVHMLFGDFGAVVLATIFTLACLTTCVGLVTSISNYFSKLFTKISYKKFVIGIVVFSFIICNMGLSKILAVSVPVLDAIYPVSIVLILLGLFDRFYKNNRFIYPITIASTGIVSIIYTLDKLGVPFGAFGDFCDGIFGYTLGFGWVIFAAASVIISLILGKIIKPKNKEIE